VPQKQYGTYIPRPKRQIKDAKIPRPKRQIKDAKITFTWRVPTDAEAAIRAAIHQAAAEVFKKNGVKYTPRKKRWGGESK